MAPKTSISDRVKDFISTFIFLSFLNYFFVFAYYADVTTRLWKSILVAACAGVILALIRPTVKGWLPKNKRNDNSAAGILKRFIALTVLFALMIFVQARHDIHAGMAIIILLTIAVAVVTSLFFSLVIWQIIRSRINKDNHQNTDSDITTEGL